MSKFSLRVASLRTDAETVVSSIAAHADELTAALVRCDQELPEAQRLGRDTLGAVVKWLGSLLQQRVSTLMQAEMHYVDEQADDPAVRAERDVHADALYQAVVQVRERVEHVMGSRTLIDYALHKAPPRRVQPAALADYASAAIKLMRAKPLTAADRLGSELSLEQLATAMDERLVPLQQSLAKVQQEKRELEAAMLQRDRSQAALNEGYQSVAGVLTYLYRLGALTGLAERVKPAARRVRSQARSGDASTGDAASGGTTPAESAPSAAPAV